MSSINITRLYKSAVAKGFVKYKDTSDLITMTLIQQWLRENHNIDVIVDRVGTIQMPREGFDCRIYAINCTYFPWDLNGTHPLYESALKTGLTKAVGLVVINKTN